jgi:hypothetical protein
MIWLRKNNRDTPRATAGAPDIDIAKAESMLRI